MSSKQKKTVSNAEKQCLASPTTVQIFDERIGANEKEELPRRNPKPMNRNIFADTSNRAENHQKGHVEQNMTKKKKKGFTKKKNFRKNQNQKKTGTANDRQEILGNTNHVHDPHRHYNPHNQQDFLGYGEANMSTNYTGPTGCQEPFTYIGGSQHTFPIPHPQQHIFADDGNAKILLDNKTNGGGGDTGDSDRAFNNNRNDINYYNWLHSPIPWQSVVNMVDNDTRVDYVVLTHRGESRLVQIPSNVGDSLKKELLIQKEDLNASTNRNDGHYNDRNVYASIEAQQGRPVHGNITTIGFSDQIHSSTSSVTSAEHQAGGMAYSMTSFSGHSHQYPNGHSDFIPPYGITMNHYPPYNGCGHLPHPGNNGGMPMAPSPYFPMMQQQIPHPPRYFSEYQAIPPPASIPQQVGSPIPGHYHPNTFDVNAKHIKPACNEAMKGESPNNTEEHGDEQQRPNDYKSDIEATPNRARVNQDDTLESDNNPNIQNLNQLEATPRRGAIQGNNNQNEREATPHRDAMRGNNNHNQLEATPHRGAMRANGGGNLRRVSISPVGPSSTA